LVVASSLAVLVLLAFAMSVVAAQCVIYKITWVGKGMVFLVGWVTTLASVFGVASAALGANANFFTHLRNHGLRQGC